MAPPCRCLLLLAFFLSSLSAYSNADIEASVVFLDGASHTYLRDQPDASKANPMSVGEVASLVSVLLGFAPSPYLSSDSASKMNNVLLPNPFNRPQSVLLLEVEGVDGENLPVDYSKLASVSTLKVGMHHVEKVQMMLPDDDEVLVIRPDDLVDTECGAACLDTELGELATWLGGTYRGTLVAMDGQLTLPLLDGRTFILHVEKEAELKFASGLVSLFRNIQRAVEIHEDFSASSARPAMLILNQFTGIKALEAEYGSTPLVQDGIHVFQTAMMKCFELLRKSYEGKIVGVVLHKNMPNVGKTVDVVTLPRAARLLKEVTPSNATISEVVLVRQSLAWITGLILLISTLIGVCLLMNMPLTKDTILYSNIKLD